MTTTKMRMFAVQKDASDHLATQPEGAFYMKRSKGNNPNPGRAAARLAARGVLTETLLEVLELKDGTFAVPVPVQTISQQATAADGSKYTEVVKTPGHDALAVEKDQATEVSSGK